MNERKHPAISVHQTLIGQLEVDWLRDYNYEFNCPYCNEGKLIGFNYSKTAKSKLSLNCNSCTKQTYLTARVKIQIYNYRPNIICPNPLCTQIGPNGQKGWVYQESSYCRCDGCGIYFNFESKASSSWVCSQNENKLQSFCFDDNIWDLRHFCVKSSQKTINFQSIEPTWYQLLVKQYIYYLLKQQVNSFRESKVTFLRQFGLQLQKHKIKSINDITREVILSFIDMYKTNKSYTLCVKLSNLKKFLEWQGLEATHLIRHRDFPKQSRSDVDWLDEVTRTAIKDNLAKIPAPIARHYLVQEYTAARSKDVCYMAFNCLVEENGQWYIQFYQHKVNRFHKLPATREIRRVIEEQQHWIIQTLGVNYTYLFCHFRVIRQSSYPDFLNMKPLPIPPKNSSNNPMLLIIRMLIKKEDIRDVNGNHPHFTVKITRTSRLQEVRIKHGISAAQLYADHKSSTTTFQHYAPPTIEQVAQVDLPFQSLLINSDNKFLPWQSLPESLLQNPDAHELDINIAPRFIVFGHCALEPSTPCPYNLYPKCYGCGSFRPSTFKLSLYERQYEEEKKRMQQALEAGAELVYQEAQATLEAMDKWLNSLRMLVNV